MSDHRLLTSVTRLSRPPPIYKTITRRPWRNLDVAKFRDALQQSTLCQPDVVHWLNVDDLAQLYTTTLDHLVPQQTVRCRQRPSDLWYDDDCPVLKRRVRRLERTARRSGRPADQAAWSTQRRAYHVLLRQKRENFWTQKIDAERTCPHKLWRSIDALIGRRRVLTSDIISVTEYHAFFDRKVADVRATTGDATPATYTSAPPHCALPSFDHWTSLTSSRLSSCCPTNSALPTQCQRGC